MLFEEDLFNVVPQSFVKFIFSTHFSILKISCV